MRYGVETLNQQAPHKLPKGVTVDEAWAMYVEYNKPKTSFAKVAVKFDVSTDRAKKACMFAGYWDDNS